MSAQHTRCSRGSFDRIMTAWGICLCALAACVSAQSADSVTPALAPDPEVMAILDGLGENSSAILSPLKTVGEWNAVTRQYSMHTRGPLGRDYTIKAVWMPDRKRAFFCGANHGAPHRLNDAWEFDLPSHTWALLFAPDPHMAKGVKEVAEGKVLDAEGKVLETVKYGRTKRGGPAHQSHTWWGLAYDQGMKAALWMNVAISDGSRGYVQATLGTKEGVYEGPPLWAFFPHERRWQHVLTPRPWPKPIYAGAMEYVPELGGTFWYAAEWNGMGMYVYRADSNAWHNLKPGTQDGRSMYHSKFTPRAEAIMGYDQARKIVVAQSRDRSTCHYDVEKNAWEKVLDPGKDKSDLAPVGHDAYAVMYYDPANRVFLAFETKRPDGIWVYEPGKTEWTRHTPNGPTLKKPNKIIGYFDEARNVFVVNNGTETWVYRYK